MNTIEKELALQEKILLGIKRTHERVVEFKKQKGTPLVVMRGNEIVKIKPWEK
ncbi:hypothetical protein [Dyadobacter sediminis]|uniref:hypothetical protein n=1 Tax=Dyadobacter sediminis TaxID=1493691 RepID=UPI001486F1D5|nr:hypothetical protein [Dyadobacter sediminis]GGC08640.1 hypothetical protein GCM10011325_39420 [Dyadobacter sediminis]